jgi:hypothetical protein
MAFRSVTSNNGMPEMYFGRKAGEHDWGKGDGACLSDADRRLVADVGARGCFGYR